MSMRIEWVRSPGWRQARALERGESVPELVSQEIGSEIIRALPPDLRALVVRDGDVVMRIHGLESDGTLGMYGYDVRILLDAEPPLDASWVEVYLRAAIAQGASLVEAAAQKRAAEETARARGEAERAALRARILPELAAYLGHWARPEWLDGRGAARGHDAEWQCLTDAERDAVRAEDARRVAEVARARLARLAALAGQHGVATVRERIAAGPAPLGLLPEEEAERIARDAVLPAGGDAPAEYAKMTRDDVDDHHEDEYADGCGGKMSYVAPPATALDADEWRAVQAVRAALAGALPEGSRGALPGEILRHRAECSCEGSCYVTRLGLRLTVDLGDGVRVSREYAIE